MPPNLRAKEVLRAWAAGFNVLDDEFNRIITEAIELNEIEARQARFFLYRWAASLMGNVRWAQRSVFLSPRTLSGSKHPLNLPSDIDICTLHKQPGGERRWQLPEEVEASIKDLFPNPPGEDYVGFKAHWAQSRLT